MRPPSRNVKMPSALPATATSVTRDSPAPWPNTRATVAQNHAWAIMHRIPRRTKNIGVPPSYPERLGVGREEGAGGGDEGVLGRRRRRARRPEQGRVQAVVGAPGPHGGRVQGEHRGQRRRKLLEARAAHEDARARGLAASGGCRAKRGGGDEARRGGHSNPSAQKSKCRRKLVGSSSGRTKQAPDKEQSQGAVARG